MGPVLEASYASGHLFVEILSFDTLLRIILISFNSEYKINSGMRNNAQN